ncbi:MAG: aminoacetone oxidase family FAD-binding enzyme [Oscillospiraceae bacterium]|nr:aminoacetone oxidase family FAD-binding enzyme [Oscillospiraceae bacterium]
MSKLQHTDIAIIGGGASGLVAALSAARLGAAVAVLEKLPRVGKKLLATGNGRCNLGNLSADLGAYHGSVDVSSVLARFPGEEAFFAELGLVVRPDEAGRLYPASGQATSVLDALRLQCAALGVREVCDFAVREIRPEDGGFLIRSSSGDTVRARRVVLACGGMAGPQYGTSGEGLQLAEALGHSVTVVYPALGPVAVEPKAVRALKGLRVQAKVTAVLNGRPDAAPTEEGQVQFGDGVLSGICVFNLAGYRPEALSLDLVPWCADAVGLLREIASRRAEFLLEDFLTGLVPKRVGQVLLQAVTEKPLSTSVSALSEKELTALAGLMKDWRFAVVPRVDWEAAQVTAGGVTGVGATLESPIVPGLFFAGEVLDVHGDTGGVNLRWAWASGVVAGCGAAGSLK